MIQDTPYVIASEARFELVDHEWIEIRTRGAKTRVAMDAYQLIAEFRSARTPTDVYSSIDSDVPLRELLELLSRYISAGVLVPAVAEPVRERCPSEVFKHELLENTALQDKIVSALRRGSFCVIPNAFREEVAEEVYRSLDACDSWSPYEGHASYFHYKHHNLYDPSAFPESVEDCRRVLSSPKTKKLVERLSGEDCSGELLFGASRYLPGDYSLPHHDRFMSRSVAYVWHLTKNWDPSWGGHLVWCSPMISINPAFNTLIVFRVTNESFHFVSPVAPYAQGKRMTINGWWSRSDQPPDAPSAAHSPAAHPPAVQYNGAPLEHLDSNVYASPDGRRGTP